MGCLYVLALEVGSLVGLSACGACPGGWSPAQRAPFQGRVGRHGGESVAAGSDSRVPLGAGAPPTRRLRGPLGASRRAHRERRASHWDSQWTSRAPTGTASGTFKSSEWEQQGAARSPHWVPRGRRGALAGSHSLARGALRVRPLGGRATTVRSPLPLGDLPTLQQVFFFSDYHTSTFSHTFSHTAHSQLSRRSHSHTDRLSHTPHIHRTHRAHAQ